MLALKHERHRSPPARGLLALAGRVADGTTTARTGPKTLRTHPVPRIAAAARAGGARRPAPWSTRASAAPGRLGVRAPQDVLPERPA